MIYYFQYANGETFIHTDAPHASGGTLFLQCSKNATRNYPYNLCWLLRWDHCCATLEYDMHKYRKEESTEENSMEEVV